MIDPPFGFAQGTALIRKIRVIRVLVFMLFYLFGSGFSGSGEDELWRSKKGTA
jgi:hypothetical protein